MCSGPRKPSHPQSMTENSHKTLQSCFLLELAASNDLPAFKHAVEIDGHPIDGAALWYCRSVGSSKMISADRTPLMIAALYGSTDVLSYIIQSVPAASINRLSESDGATALHLAAAGGSTSSSDAVKILLDASADVDSLDLCGRRPGDVIAKQSLKSLDLMLKSSFPRSSSPTPATKEEEKKKEYPPDLTLPDIKNGIYGTDEFRMYTFKVKPCSRAYSHDWTECPFVHPGENARRRDPRKYVYSCVPCPEFRKGSCRNGDGCEYAHGVFECWLHPAQYRTRLCKDETGCNRRVCFFAHKPEELRSVNPTAASVNAGLVIPSPRSAGVSSLEMAAAAYLLSSSPMSPSAVSTGMGSAGAWMSQAPTLQLPSSRLKSAMSARDLDVEFELMGLEGYQQKLLDEIQSAAAASPRASWPAAASSMFGSQLAQNQSLNHQLLSGYGSGGGNLPSSPTLNSSTAASFALDHSMAKAIMNSRSAAFAKRSQSFCDRGAAPVRVAPSGLSAAPGLGLSDWGSPDGKLDWGIQGEELNKLRKSASFGFRNSQTPLNLRGGSVSPPKPAAFSVEEPDLSWVQSLVKDGPMNGSVNRGGFNQQKQQQQFQMNGASAGDFLAGEMYNPWGEEQMVA